MPNMTLIITGANGQLGKCFLDHIANNYMFARSVKAYCFSKDDLDITDATSVRDRITDIKRDEGRWALINCAAYTNVQGAELDSERCNKVNIEGTQNLADVCKDLDIRLTTFSTNYVFSGTSYRPYKEDSSREPINNYGLSKLYAEKVLLDMPELQSDIIRTSWVVSPYKVSFIEKIVGNIIKDVPVYVSTEILSRVTLATDLAYYTLCHLMDPNSPTGVHHFCSTKIHSPYSLVYKICSIAKLNPKVTLIQPLANVPPRAVLHQSHHFAPQYEANDNSLDKYIRELVIKQGGHINP